MLLKKNCVISAVGKNSLHRLWINDDVDYDVHLIIYDDSLNIYKNDTSYICSNKGNKLTLIYQYLHNHPKYLNHYSYFFFPDDDIIIYPQNITELFYLMEQYSLQIAQPALHDSYYTYEHTLRDRFCVLRFTNFVEMMIPCFSKESLNTVLFSFIENNSGWGVEYHWPHLIKYKGREMAIIDQVIAIHTRPIQSNNPQNNEELYKYLKHYNLKNNIHEDDYIPSINSPFIIRCIDRKTYLLIRHNIESIKDILLSSCIDNKNIELGLSGLAGISLFIINYYRLTGKRDYLNIALKIADWIGDKVAHIKDDLSFSTGLVGLGWFIKYLSQHGFILNNTENILSPLNDYIKNNFFINIDHLFKYNNWIEIAMYLLEKSHKDNNNKLAGYNQSEIIVLKRITSFIYKWIDSISEIDKYNYYNAINSCIFLHYHQINTNQQLKKKKFHKLISILSNAIISDEISDLKGCLTLLITTRTTCNSNIYRSFIIRVINHLTQKNYSIDFYELFLLEQIIRDNSNIIPNELALTAKFNSRSIYELLLKKSDYDHCNNLYRTGLGLISLAFNNTLGIESIYYIY